jgi:hypothetical protein
MDRFAFMTTIITIIDALQDAWEMRRAIRPRYPLNDD